MKGFITFEIVSVLRSQYECHASSSITSRLCEHKKVYPHGETVTMIMIIATITGNFFP
jgi:hypothetical protein